MWFASCLIISCYFNTTLTSFFTEPGRLEQLKTVQNIMDSKIPIAIDELLEKELTQTDRFHFDNFLQVQPSFTGVISRTWNVLP